MQSLSKQIEEITEIAETAEPIEIGPAWYLKILSGTHQGSEIKLSRGVQTLGNNEDCDIVLWDEGLAGTILELDFTGAEPKISVTAINGKSLLNGNALDRNSVPVKPYDRIAMGGIELGVYNDDALWSMAPTVENASEVENLSQLKTNDKRRHVVNGFIFAGLMAILGAVYFVMPDDQKLTAATDAPLNAQKLNDHDKIVALLERKGMQHLQILSNESSFEILGMVPTDIVKEELSKSLIELSLKVDSSNIVILTPFLNEARRILDASGFPEIEVSYGKSGGSLKLAGYTLKEDLWNKALQRVKDDIYNVKIWENEVDTLNSRLAYFQAMLVKEKLDGLLVVNAIDNNIEIRGSLQPDLQEAWGRVQDEFVAKFDRNPRLVDSQPKIRNLEIRSITMGKIPYLTMTSGEVFMKGSKIDELYVLQEIFSDRIILERSGELFSYYLDQKSK